MKIIIITFAILSISLSSCGQKKQKLKQDTLILKNDTTMQTNDSSKIIKTEEEWKKILPSDVFYVARMKGTERPGSSIYEHSKDVGTFYCKVCGNGLFLSNAKFESGCGWPSFYQPVSKTSILYAADNTHGMVRTEVMCGKCKSHLGHVFDDGPPPTGLRYCINGVVLDFKEAQKAEKEYQKQTNTKKD
jgi:peptide-methionine (R)-S-oxide reductase